MGVPEGGKDGKEPQRTAVVDLIHPPLRGAARRLPVRVPQGVWWPDAASLSRLQPAGAARKWLSRADLPVEADDARHRTNGARGTHTTRCGYVKREIYQIKRLGADARR